MTTLLIFIIVCLLFADIILLVSLNRIMRENGRLKEKYTKMEKRLQFLSLLLYTLLCDKFQF